LRAACSCSLACSTRLQRHTTRSSMSDESQQPFNRHQLSCSMCSTRYICTIINHAVQLHMQLPVQTIKQI
jgi:hypothetical protein